jgi:hypothetical protein
MKISLAVWHTRQDPYKCVLLHAAEDTTRQVRRHTYDTAQIVRVTCFQEAMWHTSYIVYDVPRAAAFAPRPTTGQGHSTERSSNNASVTLS